MSNTKLIIICHIIGLFLLLFISYGIGVSVGELRQNKSIVEPIKELVEYVPAHDSLTEWDIMILAIAHLETGGTFKTDLKNPKSTATGILQLLNIYVQDVNRIVGYNKYTLEDRYCPVKSIDMFNIIQSTYNKDHDIRTSIHRHSVGFAPEDINYINSCYRVMDNIERYEQFRQIIMQQKGL